MSYLLGTFSKTERALPLKNLNVRTDLSTVTFRLVPTPAISLWGFLGVWIRALRPRSFLQVLVPLLYVLLQPAKPWDPDLALVMSFGLVLTYGALLLRNDIQDHLSGFDQMRSDRGSRAIQSGRLTAADLIRGSWILLALAGVCALFLIFLRPALAVVFLLAGAIAALILFRREKSFRDLKSGAFALFLLNGPLLFIGLSIALYGNVEASIICAGLLWGWMILFPLHLRDLENLIVEGQSGRGSLVGRLGFDRAQKMIHVWWLVTLISFAAFHFFFGGRLLIWALFLLVVLLSIRFAAKLQFLSSPAGSAVSTLRRQGELLFRAMTLLWILDSLWSLAW